MAVWKGDTLHVGGMSYCYYRKGRPIITVLMRWLCTGMRRVILLSSFIIDYLLAVNISFVSTHNITWALNERNIQVVKICIHIKTK